MDSERQAGAAAGYYRIEFLGRFGWRIVAACGSEAAAGGLLQHYRESYGGAWRVRDLSAC